MIRILALVFAITFLSSNLTLAEPLKFSSIEECIAHEVAHWEGKQKYKDIYKGIWINKCNLQMHLQNAHNHAEEKPLLECAMRKLRSAIENGITTTTTAAIEACLLDWKTKSQ